MTGRPDEDTEIEVEELDTGQGDETTGRRESVLGPAPPAGGIARFAVGALVLALALGMILVGFGSAYYEVTYRTGDEPDAGEDDDAPTVRHTIRLTDWEQATVDSDGNTVSTETMDYSDDAPLVGVAMDRLRWTGYVGVGLAVLALIAAVLHRFGALTVPGPAPVMATFASILLLSGVVPFVLDIPTYARSQWIPGFLDLVPAFFTMNADGNAVHDVTMGPLAGFWLHTVGALAVPVGAVLTFWDHVVRLRAKARSLAEEAVVD